ncbi:YqzE family protein [Paenibacillus pasadenensis]|uniref:YqzE family protein n=1 Tax=Paenibacillus pasadenensis TaxID=217090 RepID=UPI00203E9FA4|nr:YqzE family protein [Paenibacillus pasadenensis]MCM3747201.1 YqzE family protein [Paenibacillus pasadenensis]
MDSEEWIKDITVRFVRYVETPRKVHKENRKHRKQSKEPWLTRWFGMSGMGISMWLRGFRR